VGGGASLSEDDGGRDGGLLVVLVLRGRRGTAAFSVALGWLFRLRLRWDCAKGSVDLGWGMLEEVDEVGVADLGGDEEVFLLELSDRKRSVPSAWVELNGKVFVRAHSDSTRYTKGFCFPGPGGLLASSIIASETVAVKRQVCRFGGIWEKRNERSGANVGVSSRSASSRTCRISYAKQHSAGDDLPRCGLGPASHSAAHHF
jgi:hypothetical protein